LTKIEFTAAVVLLITLSATPTFAQRFTFERTFDTAGTATLDIKTERGEVRVVGTDADALVVRGTVTVKVGWDVPANAVELAQRVAAVPPIDREADAIRLREAGPDERRAVVVSYDVQLPRHVRLLVVSESGALTVQGVQSAVAARTQSGAITLGALGSTAEATTGSGAVRVDQVAGLLVVTTSSGSITATNLHGGFTADTNSGAVNGLLAGGGAVDVRTGSSGVTLDGVTGPLAVATRSGRVRIDGNPAGAWTVSSGSGSIYVSLPPTAAVTIDATSGSGSVAAEGLRPIGATSKRRMTGTLTGGGHRLHVTSRSGSIRFLPSDLP
jgi:hypothetical protein